MRRWRGLGVMTVVVVAAAVILPVQLGGADLDRTAAALALAGPAAGGAVALAVGRPNLAVGALAGVGAYVCGALSVRGVALPLALVVAVATCTGAGMLVALGTHRLETVALLATTLLLAVGLSALTQALPDLSGGQSGLGPLPPLGTPLPDGRVLHLTPIGDLHATLLALLAVTVGVALLLGGSPGARWRAVGSDRSRAAASGLRPLSAEMVALGVAGGVAGLGGALAAHVDGVATPDAFGLDVVALPLLAAIFAGGGSAVGAVVAGVGTGLVGGVLLPDLGWHGPPSATALALGLLAIAAVASLLPGSAPSRSAGTVEPPGDDPWPLEPGEFAGSELAVRGLDVRAGDLTLVEGLNLRAAAGTIHGLVGPNGAGKSSVLAALARGSAAVDAGPGGVVVLQPQGGGGFPACTVDETLLLAARGGGRTRAQAQLAARAWRRRLGVDHAGGTLCAELSAGRRRLLDLARVLLRRPTVLLCDEPLAGLDPAARHAAVSLLRAAAAAGLTIILAEHDRAAVASLAAVTTELGRAAASAAEAAP